MEVEASTVAVGPARVTDTGIARIYAVQVAIFIIGAGQSWWQKPEGRSPKPDLNELLQDVWCWSWVTISRSKLVIV
jgi:hypothetical protein